MSDNAVQDPQVEQSQDQANPDVQDQANVSQEQSEQPAMDSSNPEEQLIEINGQKYTKSEVEAGFLRQDDYTRKTQELAEKQRQLAREPNGNLIQSEEVDPQAKAVFDTFKQKGGFITKKELNEFIATQNDNAKFKEILDKNPHLKAPAIQETLIAVGQKDSRAWEDIIKDPKYIFHDLKPSKKPIRDVEGRAPSMQKETPKSVKDMTPEEYDSWKKDNLKGRKFI